MLVVINLRSSRPEVFCKRGILEQFTKFKGKHLCQSLFFNKVAGLKNTFFNRTPLVAASEISEINSIVLKEIKAMAVRSTSSRHSNCKNKTVPLTFQNLFTIKPRNRYTHCKFLILIMRKKT